MISILILIKLLDFLNITNKLKNYLTKPFMRAFDKIWLTIKS